MKIIPKTYYYSNCLFEAIRFKLRHWKRVKIGFIYTHDNPHFFCLDKKNPMIGYEFHSDKALPFPKFLWWKGYLKVFW